MKQSISVFILFVLLLSAAPASLAQKGMLLKEKTPAKPKVIAPQPSQQGPEVVIAAPEAYTSGKGVFIRWHTERETQNIGFSVTRIDKGDIQVVGKFIPGSAIRYGKETVYGEKYSLFDPEGRMESTYVVEGILNNGTRVPASPVSAQYTNDLSSIAGFSAKETGQSLASNGILPSDIPLYSKKLQDLVTLNTMTPNMNNQRSIAAQGGVKIGVRKTGMYRVTRAQLQAAGFDVNSDPTMWQLYTDGNEQSILVGPNADYVDFFGKGIDTVESDTRAYYLLAGSIPGKRMSTIEVRPASFRASNASGYLQDSVLKDRRTYFPTLLNGPASNYYGGDPLFKGRPTIPTISMDLGSIDRTLSSAHVVIRLLGFTAGFNHTVNILLNGQNIGQAIGSGTAIYTFDTTVATSLLLDGQNTIQFDTVSTGEVSFLDSIEIVFNRKHVASQNQLFFTSASNFNSQLHGFTSPNIRMFDVTKDGEPIQLTGLLVSQNGATFDANLPAYDEHAMCAVEDSGLLTPASVSQNSPSTLSTGNNDGTLVIISYKDFMTQANAWADYRRSQGVAVEVVDVEDIFDEFNYGVLSAQSIEDFLAYAKDNWQTPPRYVLLIGDASYDPRNYENSGYWDLVPSMMFDTSPIAPSEAPSDDALVDFDNDGLGELAIGRIPARTPADVSNALSKTMKFEQPGVQDLSRGVLFAYHGSSPTYDFGAESQRIATRLPGGTPVPMVSDTDPNAQLALINQMNTGKYMVNFSGHGTTGTWIDQNFFDLNQVPRVTNIDHPSIYTMLTCLNGYFIIPNGTQSLAEYLLNSTTGGAAAAWGSSGETTPDIQEIMATRFYQQVAIGNIQRLGDLIVDAKTVVPGGRDVRLSWVLIGDPMLKVESAGGGDFQSKSGPFDLKKK